MIDIYPDTPLLTRAVAERFIRAAETAIATRNRFVVALSGGNTPRPLYQLLSTDEFAKLINWTQVFVFWGDERTVPPEDRSSNYRMSRETLLDYVPIPIGNIFRMQGEIDPGQAADNYEATMRQFFESRGEPMPHFDLVMLGIGDDGHTASLFPHTAALDEMSRWVAANHVPKLDTWRITMTPTAINAAAHIIFHVQGESKAHALQQIMNDETSPHEYPAKLIRPVNGRVEWMVDQAAASLLTSP